VDGGPGGQARRHPGQRRDPSLINNTLTAQLVMTDGFSKRLFEKAVAQAHLGVAEPDDLAQLIVFLRGAGSAKLTGQAISVNGGISTA
jgi:2-hydroxycyclohexanecarboxyl-CoA dehydrogenase